RADITAIGSLAPDEFHQWIESEEAPGQDPLGQGWDETALERLDELGEDYAEKRLGFQKDFFDDPVRRNTRMDQFPRHLPTLSFFGSVVPVLIPFGYDVFFNPGSRTEAGAEHALSPVSRALIALAAMLPVVGTGIRTLRSAYEFARNTSRY